MGGTASCGSSFLDGLSRCSQGPVKVRRPPIQRSCGRSLKGTTSTPRGGTPPGKSIRLRPSSLRMSGNSLPIVHPSSVGIRWSASGLRRPTGGAGSSIFAFKTSLPADLWPWSGVSTRWSSPLDLTLPFRRSRIEATMSSFGVGTPMVPGGLCGMLRLAWSHCPNRPVNSRARSPGSTLKCDTEHHTGPLGEVLPPQPVGVLVGPALPGVVRRREGEPRPEGALDRPVLVKLGAVVDRDGPHRPAAARETA